ncbi:hypothetical protein [Achromobacter aloeverae]
MLFLIWLVGGCAAALGFEINLLPFVDASLHQVATGLPQSFSNGGVSLFLTLSLAGLTAIAFVYHRAWRKRADLLTIRTWAPSSWASMAISSPGLWAACWSDWCRPS